MIQHRRRSLVFLTLLFPALASAQVSSIQLPAPVKKAPSSRLAQMKAAEDLEKWTECSRLAGAAFAQEATLKAWVLTVWLRCARKAEASGTGVALSKASLNAYDANPLLRRQGASDRILQQEALKTRFQVLGRELAKPTAAQVSELNKLLESLEPSDRDNRARAMALYAEWANGMHDLEAAKLFYEQALDLKEVKTVRDKYAQVLLALNVKKENLVTPAANGEAFIPEGERKFIERFENAQKNNDLLALVEDCISYLNKFPHGRSSKWAHDKVLEVYFYFYDQMQTGDEKWVALRERTLSLIEKAEWSRLGDWSRVMSRRSDFVGSLRLAERALDKTGTSAWGAILLYVSGRSAQMLGDLKKAQRHFETYAENHSAGEDIAEVLFRLGLVHLRQEQWASAVAVFERLLSLKGQDRYDLSARYWMVRALQEGKSSRAEKEAEVILLKYPFSYFGLKLRAESSQGQLEWPYPLESAENLKASLKMTGPQKKSWDRMRALAAAGWRAEALEEALSFPLPEDGKLKALLAQSFSDVQAFPVVIRLMNQAGDLSLSYRTKDLMTLGLPKDFRPLVEAEAKKHNLQPLLVWSLIRQESAFNTRAVSTSNALGLMQLIPPTAREVAQNLKMGELDLPDDAFQPDRNIPMGTSYLAQMIRQFQGSVPLGLAAYNAGPTRMSAFVRQRPQLRDSILRSPESVFDEIWMDELPWYETSFYVKAILRNTMLYRLLDQRRVAVGMDVWKDLVLSPSATEAKASSVTSTR